MGDELTLMRQTLESILLQIDSLQRKATILEMEIWEMEAENDILKIGKNNEKDNPL